MKKFELTTEYVTFLGRKLFRIRALIEFGNVKAGELGGYIEKEENLNRSVNAGVSGNARVYGNARVSGYACVSGNAWVSGNARVFGDARVSGVACVSGDARLSGNAHHITGGGFDRGFRTTTFFRLQDGSIVVNVGSFY